MEKGIQFDLSPDEDAQYAAARENPSPIKLLHVSFNQDYTCFASGTDRGFRCYTCDPFRELTRKDLGGGVGAVEMLSQSNAPALVGGGDAPMYPLNKVMIWDKHKGQCLFGLPFESEVRGVRLTRDRLVVVLEKKILVYDYGEFRLLHEIETITNPKGLCAVTQVAGSFVMVCPGMVQGQVRVEHYSSKITTYIPAHESSVATITLSQDGKLLATASSKGTLVRIYSTHDGSLLQEVRRGTDRADIYSLAFSPTAEWLAVSSDKGTVHVFGVTFTSGNVGEGSSNSPESNPSVATSSFSMSAIKGVLPKYFSSERSVAQFRLREVSQCIVGFGQQKNTVVIVGLNGRFYRCKFDPETGGEMTQLEYRNFLEPGEASS